MFTHEFYQSGNSKTKGAKTTLKASFRFKNEVAPENREKIWNRIKTPYRNGYNPLDEYLFEKEKIGYNSNENLYCEQDNIERDRKLFISRHKFRLGFDITVESNKNLKLEEMFDLEKLNKFILTGEK